MSNYAKCRNRKDKRNFAAAREGRLLSSPDTTLRQLSRAGATSIIRSGSESRVTGSYDQILLLVKTGLQTLFQEAANQRKQKACEMHNLVATLQHSVSGFRFYVRTVNPDLSEYLVTTQTGSAQ
jgi:hypothetical protein